MCVHQSSCTPKLARKCEIGFPVVRTDVRAVYSHVITKFSGTGTIYLPLELRRRASRARAPLSYVCPQRKYPTYGKISIRYCEAV